MVTLDSIGLNFGQQVLFNDVSALIHPRDRIGLVGANGAGKTTLIKIIVGQETPESGKVEKAKWVTIGYLPQEGVAAAGKTIYDEVESSCTDVLTLRANLDNATKRMDELPVTSEEYYELIDLIGGWEHQLEDLEADKLRSKIESILLGLGFYMPDMTRDCSEFSGGWQMRIALAKLLLRSPSLLLLDEPTNHLDLDSLRWLEAFLKNYEGAILMISHDRAFLDSLTTRTFSLRSSRLEIYSGNYSYYERESVARRELQEKAYLNQQKEIEKTERFIERFRAKAPKAAQVQSRIKALDRVERIEAPESDDNEIHFRFPPAPRCARTVIELKGLHKAYGELRLFNGLDIAFERGERIAIVGPNGAGKSTLARILAGEETYQQGERIVGVNVLLSYFAQHQAEELDPDRDVLDNCAEGQPLEVRQRIRKVLGSFLFSGDAVFKKTSVLSGGEKSRLALARMLLRPTNCLIMDEPTNHLDMKSKGVLQQALLEFGGTLLIVSHDRAFLDPLVTKVLEVRPGTVRLFHGTLGEFLAKKEAEEKAAAALLVQQRAKASNKGGAGKGGRADGETRQKLATMRKNVATLEARIEELEEVLKKTEAAMLDPAFFNRGATTTDEMRKYDWQKAELETTMLKWDQATQAITSLEKETE
ncbi:MAG: ABC-F family ATP-binding cassette domain-containing protein [Verrucomicrobiota bacterium]|nr:ABC-F family ATP-binding cassette domain-containing protein [Verrucomicrobiota bacterium]